MRIRAAVLERFGEPLVVEDVELAEPKAGEVLVRLALCGAAPTDLYTASGADPTISIGWAPWRSYALLHLWTSLEENS